VVYHGEVKASHFRAESSHFLIGGDITLWPKRGRPAFIIMGR
jgi:hypothetical protein